LEQQIDVVSSIESIVDELSDQSRAGGQMHVWTADVADALLQDFSMPRNHHREMTSLRQNGRQMAFTVNGPVHAQHNDTRKGSRQST
jgi:hypothetical protein